MCLGRELGGGGKELVVALRGSSKRRWQEEGGGRGNGWSAWDTEPRGSASLLSEPAGMASRTARENFCRVCWIQFLENSFLFLASQIRIVRFLEML